MRSDWPLEDFEALLQNHSVDDSVVAFLVNRPSAEVVELRYRIHAYHRKGKETSALSPAMLQRLGKGGYTCPLCNEVF